MNPQTLFAQALQHHQAGRIGEAERFYHEVLRLQPNHADAWHFLGVIAAQLGHPDVALERIQQALRLAPHNASAHCNLGRILGEQGRSEEAIAAYRRALELDPRHAEANVNLGNALRGQGRVADAAAAYRRAVEVQPDFAPAHYNLGHALASCGYLDEAEAAYRRALQLLPNEPETYLGLGVVLREQGRLSEAAAAFRAALQRQPDQAGAIYNLANVLREQGQLDEAAAACQRALELQPRDAQAHNSLGAVLKDQGRLEEAIAAFRRALEIQPDQTAARDNLLYTLQFLPNTDGQTIVREQDEWNRRLENLRGPSPQLRDRNSERPLRIGYVSADFRDHVIGRNLLPLFQHHDRSKFEVICYADVAHADGTTEEFRRAAHRWQGIVGLDDNACAETIRRDDVDILVDLSQHLDGNRLAVFARRPAPVQVSFAGYPESTGLETIGARISDRYLESHRDLRPAEQVFLLDSFWCYEPAGTQVEVNALPASKNGFVTFGCLNNFCKINAAVLRLWAQVLRQVPASRFILLTPRGSHRQRVVDFLEREGIPGQRVAFSGGLPRPAYLELYHSIDIVLDAFPYHGHTTSLDALWMGVPVVSLVGERAVSRAGLGQLTQLGLPELAAFSPEDYVRIAGELAADLPRLASLRASLRPRMETSPLMDASRFARGIEAAYRGLWRRWCAQNPAPAP